jgi:chromosomal replication initiation ATPase DnaA
MRRRDIIHVATPATPYQARMAVVKQVAARHGYDAADLIAPSTTPGAAGRKLARARGEAALALRDQFNDSWPHIGRLLGNRDHSSIITAANRFKAAAAKQQP